MWNLLSWGTTVSSMRLMHLQKKEHQDTVDHLRLAQKVGKHTKKKEKRLKKVTKELSNLRKKKKSENFNFSALHLLHDPQGKRS